MRRARPTARSRRGGGERVLVEFVSANPTGPLHVGHGRQAAYGATLADILAAAGCSVEREYYINDAGRQMDILAVSTWVRYLELCGEPLPFPQNGYRGDYVRPLAQQLRAAAGLTLRRPAAQVLAGLPPDAPAGDKEAYIDALIARARELIGAAGFRQVLELSLAAMLADIRGDLRSSASTSITGPPSARSPRAAPSITRSPSSRPRDACSVATARCGFAPRSSATRRTGWWCARTGRRPTSPPTSPITSPSASAASRASSTCSAPIITATWRGCAPASSPWVSRGSVWRRR